MVLLATLISMVAIIIALLLLFLGTKKMINKSGYIIYRFVGYEHRLIAQRLLKRKLHWHEEIHHINGDPKDNRAKNLCVLSKSNHNSWHIWVAKYRYENGKYPPFKDQRELLKNQYQGILLEE